MSSRPDGWLKHNPVHGSLMLISFVNWFVFFGITMYLGGDALGTLPSKTGFILTSGGRQTTVTESQWVFSLYYSGATLLITPAIWIAFAARTLGGKLKTAKKTTSIFVCVFLVVWVVGWYSGIGSSMLRSIRDYEAFKLQSSPPAQAH